MGQLSRVACAPRKGKDSSQCQQAAATFCAQTINARCLSRFHARARFDADPPPKSRAGELAVGVRRAPLAAASCPPAVGIGAEGAGRPPTRQRIPNRAVPPPLGARRACRLRARNHREAGKPARHVDVASAGGGVTRRGNGGGSNPPQIHGRRHGRSTRRRWIDPWAALRRSRPRTPTSPHSTSPLDQPTSAPSRPKISRPQNFPARAEWSA